MIANDIRSAYRSLRRSPLFVVVATLTLGIGIGLTTTMLSMLDAIRNPYVPYDRPEQLFSVTAFGGGASGAIGQYEKQWALIEGTKSFQGITSSSMRLEAPIVVEGREFSGDVISVAPNYFRVLGAPAEFGRVLGSAGDEGSAVIGYGLWQRAFASRPIASGLSLTVDDRTYQVVGVMPREVRTEDVANKFASVWILLPPGARGSPVVRLHDDVPLQTSYAELAVVANRLGISYGRGRTAFQFRLNPFQPPHFVLRDYQKALGGAAIAILLIACANLANLLLVRGLSRRKELSLRLALGAGRRTLIRQLLTESGLVGALGGVAGAVVSVWGIGLLRSQFPSQGSWFGFVAPQMSWTVFTTAVVVTAVAVVVFGLAPVIIASQVQLNEPLKEASGTTSRRTRRTYALVVVAEMALCLALLMGSGILLRAASLASRFDFGYETDGLVTSLVGSFTGATSLAQRQREDPAAFARAVDRIARMDGVRGATTYSMEPVLGGVIGSDAQGSASTVFNASFYHAVGPAFFRTLGVPVISGRDFQPGDQQGGEPVAILGEETARALWLGQDPVGRMIKVPSRAEPERWIRVVGVTRQLSLVSMFNTLEFVRAPLIFVVEPRARGGGQIVARVEGNQEAMVRRMNQIVRDEVPSRSFTIGFQPWFRAWQQRSDGRITLAALFGVFGLIAVGLAAIGLYGVLAYSVGQRMREFAVRIALGALPRDLHRLVLRDGAIMILGGIAGGAFLGMAGSSLLDFWLFEVAPTDAASLVTAEAVLLLVAFVACLAPARRAAKADPLQIIRAL